MADALALYRAVMGTVWEDEARRFGAARDAAGTRQGRGRGGRPGRSRGWTGGQGDARWGQPCPRNLMRAAGGSQAAVFKRIRAGGCKSPRALRDQLSYVNDKAVYVTSPLLADRMEGAILSPQEKMAIVDAFTERWRGDTKLGHTSHMLLSFPLDVPADAVREIAVEWAERLFESGHYGDTWDYVLAVHDDRAHKHAHVVLNNRGRDHGTWFSCWAEGVMSPQHLREVQAEVAAEHGYALEATSRLERGLVTAPAGLEEVYAARAEGRAREEPDDGVVETAEARAAVVAFAREQRALGDLLERSRHEALARAIRAMAECLEDGEAWEAGMAGTSIGAVALDEIRTVGDAMAYAGARWAEIDAMAAALEPEDRARFEIKAADVKAELAELLPDAERWRTWTAVLAETYPPGAGLEGAAEALRREGLAGARPEAVEAALGEARELGLDAEEMAARLEAGGTRSYGLASEWTERDVAAILARDGMDPAAAGEAQREAATLRLDAVQERLRGAMLEEGAEARLEMPPELAEVVDPRADRGASRGAAVEDVIDLERVRAAREAEKQAYLAAHPELLASHRDVYELSADGSATLREDGQAARVMRELAEMGVTERDPDPARIAAGLAERHPDMPDHVARDLGVTYATTAELVARRGGRALGAAPDPEAQREREQAEQRAYLAAHPELLASPDAVYTIHPDGSAALREGGQAPRVLGELAEMGVAGTEADAEARIAAGFAQRHPDMPGHVARDLAITYAQTAKLAAQEEGREGGAERELVPGGPTLDATPDAAPDLDLQALALRLRSGYLAEEEKPEVARALEAALHRHLGAEGMARLDEGDHEALAGVLPSIQDRMNITQERLDLRRELSRERGLERDMDDDMGL